MARDNIEKVGHKNEHFKFQIPNLQKTISELDQVYWDYIYSDYD